MRLLSQIGADAGAPTDRLALVLAVFALMLAPLGLMADKAVVPLTLAAALAGGFAVGRPALPRLVLDRGLAAALGALTLWCLVASAWSFQPTSAATLALRVGAMLFALLYLVGLVRLLDQRQSDRVILCLCAGYGITVLLVIVELAFGTPLFNLIEGEPSSPYRALSRLNRGISALAILVWPLVFLAWRRRWRGAAVVLPAAILVLTLFSQSSASVVALAAGISAVVIAGLARPLARLVLALAVVGTLFGSLFVADLVQQANIGLLPETTQYRLHIWTVVAERIAERPILGWGFDASPDLPTGDFQPFRRGERVIPSHPHNGALQVWVETGLIGVLLTLAVLFVVALRIDRLPAAARACAVAMAVTVLGIAATAYGIWQSHWLAMIGAAAASFLVVLPSAEAANAPRRPSPE